VATAVVAARLGDLSRFGRGNERQERPADVVDRLGGGSTERHGLADDEQADGSHEGPADHAGHDGGGLAVAFDPPDAVGHDVAEPGQDGQQLVPDRLLEVGELGVEGVELTGVGPGLRGCGATEPLVEFGDGLSGGEAVPSGVFG
jgi:hypothetical protein